MFIETVEADAEAGSVGRDTLVEIGRSVLDRFEELGSGVEALVAPPELFGLTEVRFVDCVRHSFV